MKAAGFQQHSVKLQDRRYLENVNRDCGSSIKNWMVYATDLFRHPSGYFELDSFRVQLYF